MPRIAPLDGGEPVRDPCYFGGEHQEVIRRKLGKFARECVAQNLLPAFIQQFAPSDGPRYYFGCHPGRNFSSPHQGQCEEHLVGVEPERAIESDHLFTTLPVAADACALGGAQLPAGWLSPTATIMH